MDTGGFLPGREKIKALIRDRVRFQPREKMVDLYGAYNRIAAIDIIAERQCPQLPTSKVDGIAVRYKDFAQGLPDTSTWQEGTEFVYASHGCALGSDFDTVIASKAFTLEDGLLTIKVAPDYPGELVRHPGSLIANGEVLVPKYTKITPPLMGLLAGGGVKAARVFSRPRILFIPTGDELISWQETEVSEDKNIESNSLMLEGFAEEFGARLEVMPIVPDDKEDLAEALNYAVEFADLVIISAGTSKGNKDFTKEILAQEGTIMVDEVGCNPGRYLCMAVVKDTPILSLTGSPNGAELSMRFYLSTLISEYYNQPDMQPTLLEVEADFTYIAPKEVDACLQLEITRDEASLEYMAAMLDPEAVSRGELINQTKALYYLCKGEAVYQGDKIQVELITNKGYL